MVGIVIVSHSKQLAEGVREVAEQMTQGKVRIATAGGIDDPESPIGTDPMRVMAAIEEVYAPEGVLVLMDLGSALMSAEAALEFLDPEMQGNVRLCEAPLVEGAVAAATQAMLGASLDQVIAEARVALVAKAAQLGIATSSSEPAAPPTQAAESGDGDETHEITLIIPNRLGLHARPAARVVTAAGRFQADVTLFKERQSADAKSINQVITLNVRQGDALRIVARGAQAEQALVALQALADENFGDFDEQASAATAAATPAATAAVAPGEPIGAAPGIAIGPAKRYAPPRPPLPTAPVTDKVAAWQTLQAAIHTAMDELRNLQWQMAARAGVQDAAILDAYRMILQDPDVQEAAHRRIEQQALNAAQAWQQTIAAVAERYRALDDDYLRARAGDVEDVGMRVLRHLLGAKLPDLRSPEPVILVAHNLAPSDVAQLSADSVLGLLTEAGGATSHSAILARALGIPAVVGAGDLLTRIEDGDEVAVDGSAGRYWINPSAEIVAELHTAQEAWRADRAAVQAAAAAPAQMTDGTRIEVAANIGQAAEIQAALVKGAEGVGLFRTEFLFMDRPTMPDENEQFEAYRAAAQALDGRPLIIRTLDVGGDKPIDYITIGIEANPFLGWRGIRYGLANPELLRVQLRAICRASAATTGRANVKLMFPMIGTVDEVQQAVAHVRAVQEELANEGVPFDQEMEVGIMIEVPAAVLAAPQLARHVDFFSIGTNDLTQYIMAADRGNARVARLADAFQPAVVQAIKQAADAAHDAGIWIGMCGVMAADPRATPLLLGLGLRELSMAAPAVPAVKAVIRTLTPARARAIAQEALTYTSAAEVRAYLESLVNPGRNPHTVPAKGE